MRTELWGRHYGTRAFVSLVNIYQKRFSSARGLSHAYLAPTLHISKKNKYLQSERVFKENKTAFADIAGSGRR